jgi:hypothetical protein
MTAKQAMKEFKAAIIALIDAEVPQDEAIEAVEEQYELRAEDDEDAEDEDFDDDDTDEDTFEIETEDAPIKDLDAI